MSPRPSGGYLERPAPSGLADVIEVILDKGLVIDAYVRVSLLGIELLTVDARVVLASVDTYLRFAEATNRLDLHDNNGESPVDLLGDLAGSAVESTAEKVVADKIGSVVRKPAEKAAEAAGAASRALDRVTPGEG